MTIWEKFDSAAARAVAKQITFEAFVKETSEDFSRLARIAARRRRLPVWWGLEDVKNTLISLAWHYGFERVASDGTVGFDASRYSSAGAYIRWKIQKRVQKEISKARGENQHARSGPGAPEYLSKTGELGGPGGVPDRSEDSTAEMAVERSLRFDRLAKLCDDVREFVLLTAIARGLGDDRTVIAFLVEHPDAERFGFDTPEKASAAVDGFVDTWTKQLGAKKKRAAIKGALAA